MVVFCKFLLKTNVIHGLVVQFGEGRELPTAYAFGLVEHRQHDKIRLRMNLSGEVKGFNTDEVQSCPRLLNMHPLITEVQRYFFIMKVCHLILLQLSEYLESNTYVIDFRHPSIIV